MGAAPCVLICFFTNVVFCDGYRPRLAFILYHNLIQLSIYLGNYLFNLLFAVFIEVISNFFTSIHLSRISLLS